MTGTTAPFTAQLSTEEFVLLDRAGWRPLSVVSGDVTWSSVGPPRGKRGRTAEFTKVTDALAGGHRLALQRLQEAATTVQARGVIDVRFDLADLESADEQAHGLRHFSATGTAVTTARAERYKPPPFTTHLNGTDVWALFDAGYRPLQLVFGLCAYSSAVETKPPTGVTEMPLLSHAIDEARQLAIQRMQTQAAAVHAASIVAVQLTEEAISNRAVIVTAIGTAVAAPEKPHEYPDTQIATKLAPPVEPA